jgi:hypothetical protein
MNDETLQLLLRINADITLTEAIKEELTDRIQHCLSEKEFRGISDELEKYWNLTDPIIQ